MLFVDPERKSTTVGVTVSPVRIASLAQFGDVAAVGQRLLGAERAKVRFTELKSSRNNRRQRSPTSRFFPLSCSQHAGLSSTTLARPGLLQ